ncbi:MAG: uroporphyrinogen-III synthase [Candidatus Marinimicrobia bacterium]|nr:uroporphyrinogen-III synthase [Candidatus Neomarinimicrobiota bacterium]MCF7827769.1 uroporphyrinogen-III synthase [Candidatus Neomarinimicrobiota bacterium]MCF7879476.1 uroporphyrinogen-III synthase [Candidatus Neomarinimicrobiota bacterium]
MNNLDGATILVTRPQPKASEMAELIREMDGEPVIFPTIAIEPPEIWDEVDAAIKTLEEYDWIIFSSANGVKHLTVRLSNISELSRLKQSNIAAVGSKTAEALRESTIEVDVVPEDFSAEGLLEYFAKKNIDGKRFLQVTGNKGRRTLEEGLKSHGAEVTRLEAYRNVSPDSEAASGLIPLLRDGSVDYLTFTSPSTFENFYELLAETAESPGELINQSIIAAIGPITAEAIESAGVEVAVVPEEYTVEHMLEEISKHKKFTAETQRSRRKTL